MNIELDIKTARRILEMICLAKSECVHVGVFSDDQLASDIKHLSEAIQSRAAMKSYDELMEKLDAELDKITPGQLIAELKEYGLKTQCYYCGKDDHSDSPCPNRSKDADRFAESGLTMYPQTQ